MLGLIAGAALKVAGQVAGGIANSQKRKEQRRMLQEQLKDNQAWYDRNYNADPTQRADVQRMLTQMNETIKNRNKAAKGRQSVMGGTDDSTTAVKEANNKTIADTTGQIVSQNEARKDKVEEQYMENKRQIQGQQMQMKADEAGQIASAVSGVVGTAANIVSALDNGSGGGKTFKPLNEAAKEIPKNQDDPLGVKASVTALPTKDQLNSLGEKINS